MDHKLLELKDRAHALEEAFFTKREHDLIESSRQKKAEEDEIQHISRLTGIESKALLEVARASGLGSKSWMALTLAPVVMVAWSDGVLDEAEGKKLREFSQELPAEAGELLKSWLERRPNEALFDLWQGFIHQLYSHHQNPQALQDLKALVLRQCDLVARAAGGAFGIGTVSAKEKQVLEKIKKTFELEGLS